MKKTKMKWLMQVPTSKNDTQQQYWEDIYTTEGSDKFWTVAPDADVQHKIVSTLNRLSIVGELLVPGCGVSGSLERSIAKSCTTLSHIYCTDFPAVIEIAQKGKHEKRISYAPWDSRKLKYKDKFSAIVIVNSVLSGDDAENREMLASFHSALAPGGYLIGFFPTIFCALEIATITSNSEALDHIDISNCRYFEQEQNALQTFYTPLRLRSIIRESGLTLEFMEVHFFDSPYSRMQSEIHYGITDQDIDVYGHFIICRKAA